MTGVACLRVPFPLSAPCGYRRAGRHAVASIILTALLSAVVVGSAAAQSDRDSTVMARVLERRMDRMWQDSAVRHLTSAASVSDLVAEVHAQQLNTFPDSALRGFFEVFGRIIDAQDASTCAALWQPGKTSAADFSLLAAAVDSSVAEQFADAFARMVWAHLRKEPAGPTSTAEEANAALTTALMEAPEEERNQFLLGASGDTTSAPARCATLRETLHLMNGLPATHRAEILRYVVTQHRASP